jgi:2-iminobutanoate/2-iminopropanoate deaminase
LRYIQPASIAPPGGPGSHAVEVHGWIYVSGQVSVNEKREIVGRGDVAAQADQVLKNLQACLQAAGATLHDVVELVIYMKDMADYRPAVVDARLRYFGNHRPASTVVGVTSLAHPDFLLEIKAVARMPQK